MVAGRRLRVYVIAGEASGDRLGGALMAALQEIGETSFHGIGGRDMMAAGLDILFPMTDLSVMGVAEVVPKLRSLLRRIRQTSDDVIAKRPDILLTIDSPDFTLRVAKQVRQQIPDLPIAHYVAPSVWAWRPGRAAKMARHVDHVLALLPFEPPYMRDAGMTCDFVGHPITARTIPGAAERADFRKRHGIPAADKVLLLAPGSRRSEIRRLMPVFCETAMRLRAEHPGLSVVCTVAETVEAEVRSALTGLLPPAHLVLPDDGEQEKQRSFAAADLALCASGTVTLELAAAGTPMVSAYKTNWLTAQIVRRVIRVQSANLINIVTQVPVVPELLQEHCTAPSLLAALAPLLKDGPARDTQCSAFDTVMTALGRGGEPPAFRAARSLLACYEARQPVKGGP